MIKKQKQIQISEVLEELKASVFYLFEWKKKKLPLATQKNIKSISVEDIAPYFSKAELKDWQKLNAYYKTSSHAKYLQWLEKNISEPDRNGQYIQKIKLLKKTDKTNMKKITLLWTKLHAVFFNCLDAETLKFLNAQNEEKHTIDKSSSLLHSDPLSWETKEEVAFDFYSLVQQKVKKELPIGLGEVSAIPTLRSKTSPLSWIRMLKELAESEYINSEYRTNDELIKQWVVSSLSFSSTHTPVTSVVKLNWIGQATAFAEWIVGIKKMFVESSARNNRTLLSWIEATINYPGTKRSLISALSGSAVYKEKYFAFSKQGNNVSIEILSVARVSKTKRQK